MKWPKWLRLGGGLENKLASVLPEVGDDMNKILGKSIREKLSKEKTYNNLFSYPRYLLGVLKSWWSAEDNRGTQYGHILLIIYIVFFLFGIVVFYFGFMTFALVLFFVSPGIFLIGASIRYLYLKLDFLRRYRKLMQSNVDERKLFVSRAYAGLVAVYREEVLGKRSSFGQLEEGCVTAFKEAEKSLAYWSHRLDDFKSQAVNGAPVDNKQERFVENRKNKAKELLDRFEKMYQKMQAQKLSLLQFFDGLEQQLRMLEPAVGDYFENIRLQQLSDEADLKEPEVENAGLTIFYRFAENLRRVQGISENCKRLSASHALNMKELEGFGEEIFRIEKRNDEAIKALEIGVSVA